MKINFYELIKLSPLETRLILRRAEMDIENVQNIVQPLIREVEERGDIALIEHQQKTDNVTMSSSQLKVTEEEFEQARNNLDLSIKKVIKTSADNINKFHLAQMPEEMWFTQIDEGIMAGIKITPISSVGLYVPRGTGSFPSVMLLRLRLRELMPLYLGISSISLDSTK